MRERLESGPSPEVIEYLFRPRLLNDLEAIFPPMMKVNRAHVLMLGRQGILSGEVVRALIGALVELEEAGPHAMQVRPELEELHYNIESHLIERLGPELGGRLHTARSRNDLYATVTRMNVRRQALSLFETLNEVRAQILALAEEHVETVLTGYTHMQPAQPITLGHYFTAVAGALARDAARLKAGIVNANLSPLGAGALAGTGFPIDRAYTAERLGFGGLVDNTLDAVASRDYIADIVYASAMTAATLGRMAQDLYNWYTYEFRLIDIADDVASTSSIMPQKKNPGVLEHIKAKGPHLHAALVSILGCWKNTPYTHNREVGGESAHLFDDAASQTEAILRLTQAVLRSVRVNRERMSEQARANFCSVTELADTFVREADLSFRTAHEIVATLVKEALKGGTTEADRIPLRRVNETASRIAGRPIQLSEETLTNALDPARNAAGKRLTGGPAPDAVTAMIDVGEVRLEKDRAWHTSLHQQIEEANLLLARETREQLAGPVAS